jgi:hypothetical protein
VYYLMHSTWYILSVCQLDHIKIMLQLLNILVDESRLSSCITLPLCNALSDHDAQYFILGKYYIKLTINQEIDINLDCWLVKLLIISLNSYLTKHEMKFILILT